MKINFCFFIPLILFFTSCDSRGQQTRVSTITETWDYQDEIMYTCGEEMDKILIDHPKGTKEIIVKEKFSDKENPFSNNKNVFTFNFINDSVVIQKGMEGYFGVIRKNKILIYDDKNKQAKNFGRCIEKDSAGYKIVHQRYFNNIDTSDYYHTCKIDEQGRTLETSFFVQANYHALYKYVYQGDSITHFYEYRIVNKDTLLMNDELTLKTSLREKNTWIRESKYTSFDYTENKQTIKSSGTNNSKSKFIYDKQNRIIKVEIYTGKTTPETILEIEYK